MLGELVIVTWLFCCFLNVGFAFATWTEGSFAGFVVALLLVPLGPIMVAYQWASFHTIQNQNLVLLADVIIKNIASLRERLE